MLHIPKPEARGQGGQWVGSSEREALEGELRGARDLRVLALFKNMGNITKELSKAWGQSSAGTQNKSRRGSGQKQGLG